MTYSVENIAGRKRSVGELVEKLGCAQPSGSKHLRVLSDVGLVAARRDGKRILYRTNAAAITPLYGAEGRKSRAGYFEQPPVDRQLTGGDE